MWLGNTDEVFTMSRKVMALKYLCPATKLNLMKNELKSED
jgi:hypothetical protein